MQENKMPTGAQLNPFDHRNIPVSAFETRATGRPKKFIINLSKIPAKNQKSHGSCVGHAETTAIENQQLLDGIEMDLSPRYLYGNCKLEDGNPNQGTFPSVAGKVIVDRGIASNFEVPNNCDLPYGEYINVQKDSVTAIASRQKGFAFVPIDYSFIADQISKGRIVTFTLPTLGADLMSEPARPSQTMVGEYHRVAFYGYEDISETDGSLYYVNSWGGIDPIKVQGKNGIHGCNRIIFSEWKTKLADLQVYTDIPNDLIEKAKSASKDFNYTFNINLKRGMKSREVYMLQTALLSTGDFYNEFYGDQFQTDYFGAVTEKSVKRFQARTGLPITGNFWNMTRAEMNKILSKKKDYKITKIDQNGINFIKGSESCRLNSYKDTGGVWTIGWGNTSYYGRPVTAGMSITQTDADNLFIWSIAPYEKMVLDVCYRNLNQNEFNALVSLCYNSGNLDKYFYDKVNNDTIKRGDWITYRIKDRLGIVRNGLVRRREEEFNLYIKQF